LGRWTDCAAVRDRGDRSINEPVFSSLSDVLFPSIIFSWAHVSDDIITVRLLTAPSLSITKIVMLYVIVFVV
jgi:hypothetical protein